MSGDGQHWASVGGDRWHVVIGNHLTFFALVFYWSSIKFTIKYAHTGFDGIRDSDTSKGMEHLWPGLQDEAFSQLFLGLIGKKDTSTHCCHCVFDLDEDIVSHGCNRATNLLAIKCDYWH